jgi:hypothetical protein
MLKMPLDAATFSYRSAWWRTWTTLYAMAADVFSQLDSVFI